MSIETAIQSAQKTLDANHIIANVYQHMMLPVLVVEIEWGDWKHDHLRADYLLKEMGLSHLNTIETESDGSDCYSANHIFVVA